MALTLFAFDTPNALTITVALEEMGLPYAVQVVDIKPIAFMGDLKTGSAIPKASSTPIGT
jgi:glutathione S-transferase